jgi:hypothetical protein
MHGPERTLTKRGGDRAQVASRPPLTPFACTCSFFQPVFDASHFFPPCSPRPTAASSGPSLIALSRFLSDQAPRLSPNIQMPSTLFTDSDQLSTCCDLFNPDLNTRRHLRKICTSCDLVILSGFTAFQNYSSGSTTQRRAP